MIPFLKHKHEASVSAPVESIKREPDEEAPYDGLESAAEDLCNAIEAKDYAAAAAAIRAAFQLLELEPHDEGDNLG